MREMAKCKRGLGGKGIGRSARVLSEMYVQVSLVAASAQARPREQHAPNELLGSENGQARVTFHELEEHGKTRRLELIKVTSARRFLPKTFTSTAQDAPTPRFVQ